MEKAEVLEDEYQHLFLKPLLNASTLLITFQGEAEALEMSPCNKSIISVWFP